MHKHKQPKLVPLRRTKEPLGSYTLSLPVHKSCFSSQAFCSGGVSQCPFIWLVPLLLMIFLNQRVFSSWPLVFLGSHPELSLHLSLQTKKPPSDIFFNTKKQRNSNKHFQQKAKLIFYLYCQIYNLLFATLLSKFFIIVLLNCIVTI